MMPPKTLKVSVITPVYNGAGLISDALNSIFAQTFRDFEIIIIDDGSSDNTAEVVRPFLERYPGIIRYVFQENQGCPAARNTGIKEARGRFIAILDCDDLWLPTKLEHCIQQLEGCGCDWITSSSLREENGRREERRIPPEFLDETGRKIHLLRNGLYFFSSVPIIPSGVVIRRECFDKAGLFDPALRVGEDTDMWLRFEEAGLKAAYIDEPLFVYRIQPGSMTKAKESSALWDHVKLAHKHARILGFCHKNIRQSYSAFLWRCADIFFSQKSYGRSLRCYLYSWFIYPEYTKAAKTFKLIKKARRHEKE